MKNIFSILALSLILVGCNKDEELISDSSSDTDTTPSESYDLDYDIVEYLPAPGQYINENISGFAGISTQADANTQAAKRLSENQYVSLGAWGGYIIVKFHESITNSGSYDFSIMSNAFDTSNEPGIVWVMKDENSNGLPDDTWYELKGSHFGEEGYERNYWVTYSRPQPGENTPWTDSNGETGFITWMGNYHSQDFYYPEWVESDNLTFYGSRLPQQAYRDPDTGIWQNLPFEWGYADNFGVDFFVNGQKNLFKISNAITDDNQPAQLLEIDFIKVQTAINGSTSLLGEVSTEVCGFYREN